MQRSRVLLAALAAALVQSANAVPADAHPSHSKAKPVAWTPVASVDLAAFNRDLVAGRPTMDVVIYMPSNFDPAFNKLTLDQLLQGVRAAKEIYGRVGVQINLVAVKTGAVDPRFLAIQANEIPRVPDTEYINMYEGNTRHPSEPTEMALGAFQSMIEPRKDSDRTIYLVGLQDVVMPFLDRSDARNWTVKMVRTGGLSFPSYSYWNTIPREYRGVITIDNLSTPSRARRTIAHEIGHKVMNVSHEYKETSPAHEVFADGGLMLYGSGEDIPSGKVGRWHRERLLMSPYLYRLKADGTKQWNPDYKDGGHYYDPLYGEKVIRFPGTPSMDPNW
ncbi:ImmA/IrrE family metallo-endopeptidase [Phenylobacterium sp. J367]|uniref:ImmA/IrrE family metallo-endopeptidase n=1 Tax=Phenylobacterium sp. J367 TaxID=2898435 RepID=UPI002150C176|nr:ImmA/IrrE family metallo-endopeptidase [Phenylobacterium sp. J367]MCR5877302.1 ImmA/IrrE family metallo-endopeptidase [Phenylobacterium sp. J367]